MLTVCDARHPVRPAPYSGSSEKSRPGSTKQQVSLQCVILACSEESQRSVKTHAFTRFFQLVFPGFSKLAAVTVIILAACCDCGFADVMVRITAAPGTSRETSVTISDGDSQDADDSIGGLSLLEYAVMDSDDNQLFEFISFDISSSPTDIPWDFDALLTNALSFFPNEKFVIEVTRTNLDSTEYANGGMFRGDIGGSVLVSGLTMTYSAGFDTSNVAFALTNKIQDYTFTPSGATNEAFAYSGEVLIPSLTGPFSISSRYEFTSTAAGQTMGFDSLNEASLVVPEPASMAVLSGLTAVAVPCWQRLRTKRRKPTGT